MIKLERAILAWSIKVLIYGGGEQASATAMSLFVKYMILLFWNMVKGRVMRHKRIKTSKEDHAVLYQMIVACIMQLIGVHIPKQWQLFYEHSLSLSVHFINN